LKGIRGRYRTRTSVVLEGVEQRVLPALEVRAYPHLGRGLDDDDDKKLLPRKADESIKVLG